MTSCSLVFIGRVLVSFHSFKLETRSVQVRYMSYIPSKFFSVFLCFWGTIRKSPGDFGIVPQKHRKKFTRVIKHYVRIETFII